MSINQSFSHSKASSFTMVHNTFINDPNLSFKAKGIFLYFTSKPDGWDVRVDYTASIMKDKSPSIYSGLQELEEQGYLIRCRFYQDGRVVGMEYHFSDDKTYDESKFKNHDGCRKLYLQIQDEFHQDALNQQNLNEVKPNDYIIKKEINKEYTNTDIIKKTNKKSPLTDNEFLASYYYYKIQTGALKQKPAEPKETQEMVRAYKSWQKTLLDYNSLGEQNTPQDIAKSCKAYFTYLHTTKTTWGGGGRSAHGEFATWLNCFKDVNHWDALIETEQAKLQPKLTPEQLQRQREEREFKERSERLKQEMEERRKKQSDASIKNDDIFSF